MNAMLEWMNQPVTQTAGVLIAAAAAFWIVSCYAIYKALRYRPWAVKVVTNSVFERVALLEKMIANLATTCADNTARLAGIEEYLCDKQLAAGMFGKRPGEPDRPIYLGPGEARRLGNVEFRAGDFPVVIRPVDDPVDPSGPLRHCTCGNLGVAMYHKQGCPAAAVPMSRFAAVKPSKEEDKPCAWDHGQPLLPGARCEDCGYSEAVRSRNITSKGNKAGYEKLVCDKCIRTYAGA